MRFTRHRPAPPKRSAILSPAEPSPTTGDLGLAHPTIAIELTPKERALILRYGYPFDQIKAALQAVSSSKQIETVLLDEYEVDRLIGDLCRSINHEEGGLAVQTQLNDLCNGIEYAQQTGDGELEMF